MFADENVSKQITMKGFYVPAALSLMLLSLPIAAQSVATDTILLATFNDSISLDEVVIKAHKTPRANSRWSDLQPVDLVTYHISGLSVPDIFLLCANPLCLPMKTLANRSP